MLVALGFGAANAVVLRAVSRTPRGTGPTAAPFAGTAGPTASAAGTGPEEAGALADAPPEPAEDHVFDVVVTDGRVVDPETGFDRVANIGVDGPSITAITARSLRGRRTIDASGKVVSPGFIDMVSYAPNDYGIWFKVADGVTTNLGMHGMLVQAQTFFAGVAEQGSPCHYGGAYDSQFQRGEGGENIDSGRAASAQQLDRLVAGIDEQLHQGWLGACFSPEYTPGMTSEEIVRQATVAGTYGVPCFFHGRYSTDVPPDDNARTLAEVLDVARQAAVGVHVMHITSTGGTFQMPQALSTLQAAVEEGIDATCCMYPYTFWATYLASARFSEGWQERFHIDYDDLVIPGTGERLDAASFARYRAQNKLAAAFAIPDADVVTGLRSEQTMIASDAILEPGDNNHPRSTGCFTRALGHYVRDQQVLSLPAALAKMTIMPARRLSAKAPAMARKGRLQRGADADVTIFDPATVGDRSTVENPAQQAAGVEWVLVLGQVVKSPDGLHKDVRPGQPIKSVLA
ncbi:MAG: amidohydrolase family protein [Acidimicrobiia bacterium]